MTNAIVRAMLSAVSGVFLVTSLASAQTTVERVMAIDARLQQIKASYERLSPQHQQALDGYTNVIQLAKVWHTHGISFAQTPLQSRFNLLGQTDRTSVLDSLPSVSSPLPSGVAAVSNPSTDLLYSAFSGFTQSETSTARCGSNVVVGFNDSGSVFETGFFTNGGLSFSGIGASSDGGKTFTDLGPVPPGPFPNFVLGDPVVTCTDTNTFYYSQIFVTGTIASPISAIAVSKSTDGGQTWGDPVAAVGKDGLTHFLDKDWSAVDPTNHQRLYVSYTDFDFSGTVCGFDKMNNPILRIAIEFVESDDGGASWLAPNVVQQVCGNAALQGSQLIVDSKGVLHISWINLGTNFPVSTRQILVSRFKPGGAVHKPVLASNYIPGGDSFFLQGLFRDFLPMSMAVDRSGTVTDGNLYIAWDDGRDKTVTDPLAISGSYSYDDILLVSSTDGGSTWSAPIKVNSDTQPSTGVGHDHYQPGIAVDPTGKVAACWYDRRDDTENFAIERFCGESTNRGLTWTNSNIGVPAFAPTHGNDIFVNPIYMGDYDSLASDFTLANTGFIGGFQVQGNRGNPDVVATPVNP